MIFCEQEAPKAALVPLFWVPENFRHISSSQLLAAMTEMSWHNNLHANFVKGWHPNQASLSKDLSCMNLYNTLIAGHECFGPPSTLQQGVFLHGNHVPEAPCFMVYTIVGHFWSANQQNAH